VIERHLDDWLGAWPGNGYEVVASERRERPGWDRRVLPFVAVLGPDCGVLSVPPGRDSVLRSVGVEGWRAALPQLVEMVFRFTDAPAAFPDAGVWTSTGRPGLPTWLQLFEDALVAFDGDAYLGGVGLKRHDAFGHELAVATEPSARGRGLARGLVAQAARSVLERGAIPTYAHLLSNDASAKVADAAGFPDRGWRILRPAGT